MKIEREIEELTKKYQDNPDTLINDYDEVIKNSLVGVIANFRTNDILRDDIISNIDILIRNRKFIVDQYSKNRSSND